MMGHHFEFWMLVPFGTAALATAAVTPLVILLARRIGAVALPRPDRWHQRPTALLGGIAIYAGSVIAACVTLPQLLFPGTNGTAMLIGLWAAATFVFALGLIDDRRGLSPGLKLLGQLAAASLLLLAGFRIHGVSHPALAIPATLLWVVGVTNAVNLLDNMDGAVAGVVAIASLGLAWQGAAAGETALLVPALCLSGACCGFLLYNFHPARVFMGDCGSLFLGFSISALALIGTARPVASATSALMVPILLLAIPIFDTTLVTIARRRHGRPVSKGGRDHTAHRLVALGFSERVVALQLYGGSVLLMILGAALLVLPPRTELIVAALVILALAAFGKLLGGVPVYEEPVSSEPRSVEREPSTPTPVGAWSGAEERG